MAVTDAIGRTSGGVSRLRFRLGALSTTRQDIAWFSGSLTAIAIAMVAFLRVATLRWDSFETNSFDLAFFDQIIFNSSQGRLFANSFTNYNFAGQHVEPILLAFVPAYWLGAGPYFLMVTQAVIGSIAAVPLYFFARRLGLHGAVATAAVVAYLANPYLHRSMAFDFHPEVMAALPVFIAAWAIAAERRKLAVATALSVLLFKEDTVFLALALAGYMWMRGLRREALTTATISVVYMAVAVLVVMPLARDGASSDIVGRFGYLLPGHSPVDYALVPFRAGQVLFHPDQLWTATVFVVASSLVSLWRPWLLAALLPGMALALLSVHPPQRVLELHYAAEFVPIVAITGLIAAASLQGRIGIGPTSGALLLPTILALVVLNPLGDAHGETPSSQHRAAVLTAISLVPDDENVVVSAQSGLLPRLSHRKHAYEFPGNAETAEWIVVDSHGFRSWQSRFSMFDERLDAVRNNAQLMFAADGVEVYWRAK